MKQLQQSNYNYTKLIDAVKDNAPYTDFATFMSDKIKECRDNHQDGGASSVNRNTIASSLKIDLSTLTKILNGGQKTKKRDLIIAICFELKLNKEETNMALNLYGMAALRPYNIRDLVITHAIGDGVSLKELDELLIANGERKLDIIRGDKTKNNKDDGLYLPSDKTPFIEISVVVSPDCVAGDDAKKSLHERYRPDIFYYHSEMIVQRIDKESTKYLISRDDDDHYDVKTPDRDDWKYIYSSNELTQKHFDIKKCDNPELLNEIEKLKEYTDRKALYVYNMCNDTRNYISRFDALNKKEHLVIYGETFGADAPELSEYFQVEVSNTSYIFSVSYTSIFLEKYLGQERFLKLYGNKSSSIINSFTSLDEVTNPRWRMYFQQLLKSAKELLRKLQARELFLFNARAFMEIEELLQTFHVEDAFERSQQDVFPYEMITPKKPIIGSDGKEITINDLYRAAELDIFSIEELSSIRKKYGSLENFLQLNTLIDQEVQ